MTNERYEMMKEAFELVNSFRETYRLFDDVCGKGSEVSNGAFSRYCGAKELFERLFAIDYYDAREIFKDPELYDCPF